MPSGKSRRAVFSPLANPASPSARGKCGSQQQLTMHFRLRRSNYILLNPNRFLASALRMGFSELEFVALIICIFQHRLLLSNISFFVPNATILSVLAINATAITNTIIITSFAVFSGNRKIITIVNTVVSDKIHSIFFSKVWKSFSNAFNVAVTFCSAIFANSSPDALSPPSISLILIR